MAKQHSLQISLTLANSKRFSPCDFLSSSPSKDKSQPSLAFLSDETCNRITPQKVNKEIIIRHVELKSSDRLDNISKRNGIAKVEIAVAKGKKLYDKREVKKKKDWNMQKKRLLKNIN